VGGAFHTHLLHAGSWLSTKDEKSVVSVDTTLPVTVAIGGGRGWCLSHSPASRRQLAVDERWEIRRRLDSPTCGGFNMRGRGGGGPLKLTCPTPAAVDRREMVWSRFVAIPG